MSTIPSAAQPHPWMRVEEWPWRAEFMLGKAENELFEGLNRSADAVPSRVPESVGVPPVTSTVPSLSRVARWFQRAELITFEQGLDPPPTHEKVWLPGSNNSAVAVALLKAPVKVSS